MPKFLVDCDSVLLDWNKSFLLFMKRMLPKVTIDETAYEFGIENINKYVKMFNESEFFETIPPFKDSVEYVQKIHDKGYSFVVISSCTTDPKKSYQTITRRVENLNRVFGADKFEEIVCLPLNSSKEKILKRFNQTFWVDDKIENCEDGERCDHDTFLMTDRKVFWDSKHLVSDWSGLYEKIFQES